MSDIINFLKGLLPWSVNISAKQHHLRKIIAQQLPPEPCLTFTLQETENASVFDSKVGGIPYIPKNVEYPIGRGLYANMPLQLLAQLNFDKLPHIDKFPSKGILQFFCANENKENVYGCDFSNMCNTDGFRVIYYPDVTYDEETLMSPNDIPTFNNDNLSFPISNQFLLIPQKTHLEDALVSDARFEKAMLYALQETYNLKLKGLYELDEDQHNAIYEIFSNHDTKIGGFADFSQDDPRYQDEYKNHTICLLQIESLNTSRSNSNIMWGDDGVGNFFIEPEKLEKLDFSNVMYTWDCY